MLTSINTYLWPHPSRPTPTHCEGTVGQFLTFFSKTLSERTAVGTRQTVQEQEYMCHAFSSANGLSGICIADAEYPARVAFGLLSKITGTGARAYASHACAAFIITINMFLSFLFWFATTQKILFNNPLYIFTARNMTFFIFFPHPKMNLLKNTQHLNGLAQTHRSQH